MVSRATETFPSRKKNISDWLLSTGRDALRKDTQYKTLNSHSQTWPLPRSSSKAYSPKQTMVLEAQGSRPHPHNWRSSPKSSALYPGFIPPRGHHGPTGKRREHVFGESWEPVKFSTDSVVKPNFLFCSGQS